MIRARLIAALLVAAAAPRAAQTFAISGGTVALGDGSQPIPNGMVVVRDGRIVAAGDVRMKLPAGTQVIDATGKWVTPGIVGGFTRLGLSEVDLSADGCRRHQRRMGRSARRSTWCRRSIRSTRPSPSIARTESRAHWSCRTSARASSPGKAR